MQDVEAHFVGYRTWRNETAVQDPETKMTFKGELTGAIALPEVGIYHAAREPLFCESE